MNIWGAVYCSDYSHLEVPVSVEQGQDGVFRSLYQERWEEFKMTTWDNCCPRRITLLIILWEVGRKGRGKKQAHKLIHGVSEWSSKLKKISDYILELENLFIYWRKGWRSVLACNFRDLRQGYRRSTCPTFWGPLGALYPGLNLRKPFPLYCHLFPVLYKCEMPLN